jgi:acyl-CoA thioester hydrolase
MAAFDPPSFEQVRALPEVYSRVVPSEYEDFNGHMSIDHYLGIHSESGDPLLASLGLTDQYRAEQSGSVFDVEHHLLYFGEVMVGDTVTVHGRIVDRSDKAVHGISFIADLTREEVSNTLEWISIHVSLESRRPEPWPDDIASILDGLIAEDRRLGWDPPLCGSMGVGGRRA